MKRWKKITLGVVGGVFLLAAISVAMDDESALDVPAEGGSNAPQETVPAAPDAEPEAPTASAPSPMSESEYAALLVRTEENVSLAVRLYDQAIQRHERGTSSQEELADDLMVPLSRIKQTNRTFQKATPPPEMIETHERMSAVLGDYENGMSLMQSCVDSGTRQHCDLGTVFIGRAGVAFRELQARGAPPDS